MDINIGKEQRGIRNIKAPGISKLVLLCVHLPLHTSRGKIVLFFITWTRVLWSVSQQPGKRVYGLLTPLENIPGARKPSIHGKEDGRITNTCYGFAMIICQNMNLHQAPFICLSLKAEASLIVTFKTMKHLL